MRKPNGDQPQLVPPPCTDPDHRHEGDRWHVKVTGDLGVYVRHTTADPGLTYPDGDWTVLHEPEE